MKTINITASVSRNAGGLFESVRRLLQTLQEAGVSVHLYGTDDSFTSADRAAWDHVSVTTFPPFLLQQFGYSPKFYPDIEAHTPDLVHTHGIWLYPSVLAERLHRRKGTPYIISPHGMLDPWALKHSALKKKIALALFERRHLENAACIRALCESEAQSIRAFGLKNPIAVIPNGIDLLEVESRRAEGGIADTSPAAQLIRPAATFSPERRRESPLSGEGFSPAPWNDLVEPDRKVLLYLGRIHPKKGLVNLLKAWAAIRRTENGRRRADDWVLAIAGWDQGGHEAKLKALATELGIVWRDVGKHSTFNIQHSISNGEQGAVPSSTPASQSSLLFLGPQFNEAKAACYAHCDGFVLPSFSEGLPMVVLEAWAYGQPVLMTPECNCPEGFAANAALRIAPSAEGIAQGLCDLFQMPDAERQALGANGRALVASRFTWPKIATDMKLVYEWMLGGGPKPGCVT